MENVLVVDVRTMDTFAATTVRSRKEAASRRRWLPVFGLKAQAIGQHHSLQRTCQTATHRLQP